METTATKRIEALYQIRGDDVFTFIEQHSFLVPLLMEAQPQIKTYFPESKLSLEMFVDPEAVGVRSIVVVVATKLDAETALKTLDAFDYGWWLKNLDRAQGKLDLSLESWG